MPQGPLTGGTNNQRSYSGPTTGGAFDTRTIPDSQGGGNLGVMSLQFSQSQQQAGWDAMNNAPGYFVVPVFSGNNGIAELPGPLLDEYNSWMTEFTPEAEQDLGYLLYGDLSGLATPETGVLLADDYFSQAGALLTLLSGWGFAHGASAITGIEGLGVSSNAYTDGLAIGSSDLAVAPWVGAVGAVILFWDPAPFNVDPDTGAFTDDTLHYSSGGLVTIGVTPDGFPAVSVGYSVGPTCGAGGMWQLPNYGGR